MSMKLGWGEVAEFRRRPRPGPWNWRPLAWFVGMPASLWVLTFFALKGCA